MIKISYPGNISILKQAARAANDLLGNPAFYSAISKKTGFQYSAATGAQVAASMQRCNLTLTVKTFKQPFTRSLGYEDPANPASIFINVAGNKLHRSLGSIAGTFIHEAVHAADADDEALDYPHQGNQPRGNEDTAPYWIGNLAVQMIDHPEELDVSAVPAVPHAPEDEMAPVDGPGGAVPESAGGMNFRLSVTVLNAEGAPLDITVSLEKVNSTDPAVTYTQQGSFVKQETLAAGRYKLVIDGNNTEGGTTRAEIDGHFTQEPIPRRAESSDFSYLLYFFFNIA